MDFLVLSVRNLKAANLLLSHSELLFFLNFGCSGTKRAFLCTLTLVKSHSFLMVYDPTVSHTGISCQCLISERHEFSPCLGIYKVSVHSLVSNKEISRCGPSQEDS